MPRCLENNAYIFSIIIETSSLTKEKERQLHASENKQRRIQKY